MSISRLLFVDRDESYLICPSCRREDAVHIDSVEVLPCRDGKEGVAITLDGEDGGNTYTIEPAVTRASAHWRRGTIVLYGWCESGCYFRVAFAQHKGTTFTDLQTKKSYSDVLDTQPLAAQWVDWGHWR